ncbi:MAG: hypothetical protein DRJ42_22885 [Deltaproteobacteria bacterium]|nr:MAG: hypothetical protein DRJ42_22885 [Deltaproteobacteria bacterium]
MMRRTYLLTLGLLLITFSSTSLFGCASKRSTPADTSIGFDSGTGEGGTDSGVLTNCTNGVLDGTETSPDCGGDCAPCADGQMCTAPTDCLSMVCRSRYCLVPSCSDAVQNGAETGTDCGGGCGRCAGGVTCTVGSDCLSGECLADMTCTASGCEDGEMNQDETDVDCGGALCPKCAGDQSCLRSDDCLSTICDAGTCTTSTCTDRTQNQDETSLDCGGLTCPGCRDGFSCLIDIDCEGMRCVSGACVSCVDGIQDAEETDVDCGGGLCDPCLDGEMCSVGTDCEGGTCEAGLCVSCMDGVLNQDESDADCGGTICAPCGTGRVCAAATDCASNICDAPTSTCNAPGCGDGVLNGVETDLDCGGGSCLACTVGQTCLAGPDCDTGVCTGGVCQAPTCTDGVSNGTETGRDCGGSGSCPRCPDYEACDGPSDCDTAACTLGRCGTTGCIPFPGVGGSTDTFGYFGCTIPMTPATLPCPDISATGTIASLSDDSNISASIGFSFEFYGTTYTTLDVQSNGGVSFTPGYMTLGNSCLPTSSGRPPQILTWWDDLNPATSGGSVRYQTLGSAPNRQFVVRWDTAAFGGSVRGLFTMVLEETTNDIQVCYYDTNLGNPSTEDRGIGATIGIDQGPADALQFSCNTASLSDGLLIQYIHP